MVDYWSLGITIYKLLTGKRPFDKKKFDDFLASSGTEAEVDLANKNKEYALTTQEVAYPDHLTKQSVSIIKGLLNTDETERLSVKGMMEHGFYSNLDWDNLGQMHVNPPFLPVPKEYPTKTTYENFEAMLAQLSSDRNNAEGADDDCDWMEEVAASDQQLFQTWDFVSPHTLKVEMGIAGEMEAHDTNFKVQQILGSDDGCSGTRTGNSPAPPKGARLFRMSSSSRVGGGNANK